MKRHKLSTYISNYGMSITIMEECMSCGNVKTFSTCNMFAIVPTEPTFADRICSNCEVIIEHNEGTKAVA